jgi:hypothetical protein
MTFRENLPPTPMGVRIRYVGGKKAAGHGGNKAVALPVVNSWLLALTNTLQGTYARHIPSVLPQHDSSEEAKIKSHVSESLDENL